MAAKQTTQIEKSSRAEHISCLAAVIDCPRVTFFGFCRSLGGKYKGPANIPIVYDHIGHKVKNFFGKSLGNERNEPNGTNA